MAGRKKREMRGGKKNLVSVLDDKSDYVVGIETFFES